MSASIPRSMPRRICPQCSRIQHRSPLTARTARSSNRFLSGSPTTTTTSSISSSSAPTSSRANASNDGSSAGSVVRQSLLRTSHRNRMTPEQELAQYKRSIAWSAAGIVGCAVAMYGVIKLDVFGVPHPADDTSAGSAITTTTATTSSSSGNGAMRLDGPDGFPARVAPDTEIPRVQGFGSDDEGIEQVSTGTSSVPYFPRTIKLPKSMDESVSALEPGDDLVILPSSSSSAGAAAEAAPSSTTAAAAAAEEEEEYQLVGLGIRTVSFLSIQVYVAGLYVARSDIAELHRRLLHTAVHPPAEEQQVLSTGGGGGGSELATSLLPTEREQLKRLLLDPEHGEAAWTAILRPDGLRTAWRIVPTRNTDFLHLRDGWVRGLTARAQSAIAAAQAASSSSEFQTDDFGPAVNEFKAVFGRGQRKSMLKGETLVLARSARGALDAMYQTDATQARRFRWLGRVSDERISRLVWLNYLAGKTVSSEGARQSAVDGFLRVVERPAGAA